MEDRLCVYVAEDCRPSSYFLSLRFVCVKAQFVTAAVGRIQQMIDDAHIIALVDVQVQIDIQMRGFSI